MDPAFIFGTLLTDLGYVLQGSGGTGNQFRLFLYSLPSDPDSVVTIMNTTAVQGGRHHNTGEVIQYPGLCFNIRALNYQQAWLQGNIIQNALAAINRTTVTLPDTTVWMIHSFKRTMSLTFLGQDEKNRRQSFSIDGTTIISEVD